VVNESTPVLPGATMLARLIYTSAIAMPIGPADITALLRKARLRNALSGLSGLLTFDSRFFLQAIEGSPRAINDLYSGIVNDPRHRQVTLLKYGRIGTRMFPDWQMGFLSASAEHRALYSKVMPGGEFDPFSIDGDQAETLMADLAAAGARNDESVSA
jgi:hypothetical protein